MRIPPIFPDFESKKYPRALIDIFLWSVLIPSLLWLNHIVIRDLFGDLDVFIVIVSIFLLVYVLISVERAIISLFKKRLDLFAAYLMPIIVCALLMAYQEKYVHAMDNDLYSFRFLMESTYYKDEIKNLASSKSTGKKFAEYYWGGSEDCRIFLVYDESDEMNNPSSDHMHMGDSIYVAPSGEAILKDRVPVVAERIEGHFYLAQIHYAYPGPWC